MYPPRFIFIFWDSAEFVSYALRDKMKFDILCPKIYKNFRDITRNVEENFIQHKIVRVISRFPCYILVYISENRLPSRQCIELSRT